MNQEIKARWLEALRGNKYKQGMQALRKKDDRFCCLGVLCDITHPQGWQEPTENDHRHYINDEDKGNWFEFNYKNHLSGGFLPFNLAQELELTTEQESELTAMNDAGKTFSEIADWIEVHL